jgi:hypothetical protein
MTKRAFIVYAALLFLAAPVAAQAAGPDRRTVIYDGVVTEVAAPPSSFAASGPSDLWVTLADLKRATGFVVKPKGICRDELCFPIPRGRRQSFLSKRGPITWFNMSEFARLVRQPAAYDTEQAAWFFGPRADEQNGYLATLTAPDFELPDMNGKLHSLSGFRGRKVLLLTWASW